MKRTVHFVVISVLLLFWQLCQAVPSQPTVASGTISAGSLVVITGSGFGAKATAAPLRYDDFENGALGVKIPNEQDHGGWSIDGMGPIYSDTVVRYAGRQSALQRYAAGNSGQGIMLDNRENSGTAIPSGTRELYVTGWFWMETGDAESRNVKFINMGTSDGWQTRIDMYPKIYSDPPTYDSGHMYSYLSSTCGGDTNNVSQDWSVKPSKVMLPDKKWHRVETYLRIGTDGYRDLFVDGIKRGENSGGFTASSCDIDYLLIGHYYSTDTGLPTPWANRYWDEIYVDTTRARVEIGNAPTWETSTHREVQIPTSWATGSISFTANPGTFSYGQTAYLYVIDGDGNVSPGRQIVIGASGSADGGVHDAGASDAGASDAGAGDAGAGDASAGDASAGDASAGDAGEGDAAVNISSDSATSARARDMEGGCGCQATHGYPSATLLLLLASAVFLCGRRRSR